MSLKKVLFKTKLTYYIYLYYNLYIRHKCFLNRTQYSQWGEDLFINNYFQNQNKGIYLDVGCFHPYMYSNTCLLNKKNWSGINIDINSTSIDLFNIARPKDFNICTTISETNQEFKIYYDDPFSPVNTLDKNFYKNLKKTFFKNEQSLSVKSKTFKEIIELSKINSNIDFINIDAEGLDYEILKQIEIKRFNIRLISIETHNVDGTPTNNFNQITNFLKDLNFKIYKRVGPTTLYDLKS